MKPCDVRSIQDYNKLLERGLDFNNHSIGIDSTGVIIEIFPHIRVKITHKNFNRFAHWYFEDQTDATNEDKK